MNFTLSAYVPLLSAVFVFGMGIFALSRYVNNRRELELVLALFCGSITVWLFGTFMMFISVTDAKAIFWDRFVYAGVVFVPTLMHHFSISFTENESQRKYLKYGYLISIAFLILSQTDLLVKDLYKYKWGSHSQAQFFHHVFILFFLAYTSVFFVNVWKYYKTISGEKLKNQAKYVFWAFLTLVCLGSLAYLPAYGISIPPFPFISGLLFIIILSYSILRHKLLDVKAAGAIFLTIVLFVVLIIDIFSGRMEFKILAALIMLIIGSFLINIVQVEAEHAEMNERLAKKLERDKKQLLKLDKMKDEFIMMATHELTTPITAIRGRLAMALEENSASLTSEQKAYLKPAYDSINRLNHLSQDLLSVSRIDQNELIVLDQEVNLDELIQKLLDIYNQEARSRRNIIAYKPKHKIPTMDLDQRKVKEIICHILENAIHFTENGKIVISTEKDIENKRVVVSISDTGVGIDKKSQNKLFNKFTQSNRFSPSNLQEQQGAGLGLYISKNLVDLMGGDIWFTSKQGEGSTFYFSLPLKD